MCNWVQNGVMASSELEPTGVGRSSPSTGDHFAPALLHTAAQMYYDEDATQAQVAARLNVSRATVSRLLSEARRRGIVQITVVPPERRSTDALAEQVATKLGLTQVFLSAPLPGSEVSNGADGVMGRVLAPAVGRALLAAGLMAGDVLLVSSGRTMYEVSRFELPRLPGVLVAPTVGGTDQPEGWFQTNEIARRVAEQIAGRAMYLFAPALPGADLYATLQHDPTIQRVLQLWPRARCVLTGVGAPPVLRSLAPQFVDLSSTAFMEAVGDICTRFFDREGRPVSFPGVERLIAVELEALTRIPVVVAVAAGEDKVAPLVAGARAHYFNQLVTDPPTAEQIVARA